MTDNYEDDYDFDDGDFIDGIDDIDDIDTGLSADFDDDSDFEDDIDESDDSDEINIDFLSLDDNFEDDEEIEAKPKPKTKQATKLLGKHSLAYDTIFKGKRNKIDEEIYENEHVIKNAGGTLDIKEEGLDNEESRSNIDYYREVRLKNEIKTALQLYTDINFEAKRRIPAKSDFNAYYIMLIKELHQFGYSKCEIFIELAGYFSDNYWNVFKLLDRKYTNIIIVELKEKYGLSDVDKLDIF